MPQGATKAMAVKVIRRLRSAGHEALLAGGCVRDLLLGRRPTDYDVATSATPPQVRRLFPRVIMVGAKFGVAVVLFGRRRVEVATFRTDLSYADGRRPVGVKFVSAREDALRRDFTINGMFFDPIANRVVDYVGGRADLRAGLVRAIGDPLVRFSEDYLRMLRAVRFAARLDFRIHRATAAAIRRRAPRLTCISGERIREELEKMFSHPSAARAVRRMHRLGLLQAVLPELFARRGLWAPARRRVEGVARYADAVGTLAGLLLDLSPADVGAIVRRWGGSNHLRESLVWMVRHRDHWRTLPEASLAELKRLLVHRDFARLERLWRIRERDATGTTSSCRALRRRIAGIDPERIDPPPLLSGRDLMDLGVPEGPRLGRILAAVREAQLNEQITTRRAALSLARKMMTEGPGTGD